MSGKSTPVTFLLPFWQRQDMHMCICVYKFEELRKIYESTPGLPPPPELWKKGRPGFEKEGPGDEARREGLGRKGRPEAVYM